MEAGRFPKAILPYRLQRKSPIWRRMKRGTENARP